MKINVAMPSRDVHSPLFLELAQLIEFSAQSAGFVVTSSRGSVKLDSRNILVSHFFDENIFNDLPPETVILNTEQLFSGDLENTLNQKWSSQILELAGRFKMWDYSQHNISKFHKFGIKVKKFDFGYEPKLERIAQKRFKPIDVLFYGSINNRRQLILDECRKRNLIVKQIFGFYGGERDRYISRSKLVLNMHYHPTQIFEIVRVHYLVNNDIPVVSEINSETQISDEHRGLVAGAPYDQLPDTIAHFVQNSRARKELASRASLNFRLKSQSTITADIINRTWGN